jgi:predicted molibdopterin-dependent oxidoreductase YjgC
MPHRSRLVLNVLLSTRKEDLAGGGEAAVKSVVTKAVMWIERGHTPSLLLNRVIGQGRDAHTSTPEYKVTAVRVERAATPEAV